MTPNSLGVCEHCTAECDEQECFRDEFTAILCDACYRVAKADQRVRLDDVDEFLDG